jgi:23S rRNA (adenine2503-C2)-methyltransferase
MFNGSSLPLEDIAHECCFLPKPRGRKYTLNFAISDDTIIDADKLRWLFSPEYFIVKITPVHITASAVENGIKTSKGYEFYYPYKHHEETLKKAGFEVLVFIPSKEEDDGMITCGNAVLAGRIPKNSNWYSLS